MKPLTFLKIWIGFTCWLLVGAVVLLSDNTTQEWMQYKHWPNYKSVTMVSCVGEIAIWPKVLYDARMIKRKFGLMNGEVK